MKIVILSSTNVGGAAVAGIRQAEALSEAGHQVDVLVQKEKNGGHPLATPVLGSKLTRVPYFLRERKQQKLLADYPNRQPVSFSAPLGSSKIYKHKLVQEADVIHIHWTSNCFISTKDLVLMSALGKPMFITFHDMWYMTGGCHYAADCTKFHTHCGACPVLNSNIKTDLSYEIFEEKLANYPNINAHLITPSYWMADMVKSSKLLKDKKLSTIRYCINFDTFKPINNTEAANKIGVNREDSKKYILFGAVAALQDVRKGFKYLLEALEKLKKDDDFDSSNIELLIFGSSDDEVLNMMPFKTTMLGNITSEEVMANVYNAADVFVAPSLEDNLPNTLIESLACGTPCVGFKSGGIPEIIDHLKNGYVAEKLNTDDLKEGIKYVLSADANELEKEALAKAYRDYDFKVVAHQHIELYKNG